MRSDKTVSLASHRIVMCIRGRTGSVYEGVEGGVWRVGPLGPVRSACPFLRLSFYTNTDPRRALRTGLIFSAKRANLSRFNFSLSHAKGI